LVTIPKTEFPTGLTQVKAKILPSIGHVARFGRVQVRKPG
jgi:hypothetical protein